MSGIDHIAGHTFHARKGALANRFTYGIDYLLMDAEDPPAHPPALFARNRAGLVSQHDTDHGGVRGAGEGAAHHDAQDEARGTYLRLVEQVLGDQPPARH